MRFDDMIATVLALPNERLADRVAKWRQIVDLLAQPRGRSHHADPAQAFEYLRSCREEVPFAVRQESARSLSGRRVDPRLLRFFTEDHPGVAALVIGGARLSAGEWLELLPGLGTTARSLLRHRRDLDPEVAQALASFGSADFALSNSVAQGSGAVPPAPAVDQGEAQIRNLVARIEAYRKHKETLPAEPQPAIIAADIDGFRWETGVDGIIVWLEGAPRGPMVGQSIASIAERGQFGVDGQAAGAFEKRAPFRDARFSVAGDGAASGDWRISGVPFFDPIRGNFLGYRGSARRPRLDETARAPGGAPTSGLFGTEVPADSLRQLIHELRTPLNAIVGFAEMIDGQYMGPAGSNYRTRAGEIMDQASRLLSAVDDLDTAARIETSRLTLEENAIDAVALLCRLHDAYERVAGQRNSRIAIEIARDLPPARVELGAAERMFARMLAATIGLARDGETISATMTLDDVAGKKMLCLAIDRPQAIGGLSEAALLDPGYSPAGDWPGAPALGLGFALRLVRNLAEAVGGALIVGEQRFLLYLPPLDPATQSTGQGGEGKG